ITHTTAATSPMRRKIFLRSTGGRSSVFVRSRSSLCTSAALFFRLPFAFADGGALFEAAAASSLLSWVSSVATGRSSEEPSTPAPARTQTQPAPPALHLNPWRDRPDGARGSGAGTDS